MPSAPLASWNCWTLKGKREGMGSSQLITASAGCCPRLPPCRQQLVSLLSGMCSDFDVVRVGQSADSSSHIDIDDAGVKFVLL